MEKEIRPWLLRETIPLQAVSCRLSLSPEVQLNHHSWPMMLELCSKPLLFDAYGIALPNSLRIYPVWESPSTNQYNQLKHPCIGPCEVTENLRQVRTEGDFCKLAGSQFHTPFPWGLNFEVTSNLRLYSSSIVAIRMDIDGHTVALSLDGKRWSFASS